ncbi:MAG: hypothetical protein ABMA64_28530 [Myxococcota bacterium]
MSDVFSPPDADPRRDPYTGMSSDGLLSVVGAMLLLAGGGSGAFVLMTAFVAVVALAGGVPQEPGEPPMWVIAPIEGAFFLIPTVWYLASAYGVFARKKWAFFTSLISFGPLMGGCCMPFGLFALYALLREDGRRAFGIVP